MHACLLQIYNHASLLFIYCNLSSKIGHDHVRPMLFKQRPIFHHAYVMHSAISCFHVLELPNDIQTADR
jgi:murein endopeptidase